LRLEELHRVAREDAAGEPRRQAEVTWLVMARIAVARLEERLATGFERREVRAVEDGRGRPAALRAGQVSRPLIGAGEIWLALGRPRRREGRRVLGEDDRAQRTDGRQGDNSS